MGNRLGYRRAVGTLLVFVNETVPPEPLPEGIEGAANPLVARILLAEAAHEQQRGVQAIAAELAHALDSG